jgi:putative heme-binding domain-containing protein
MEREPFRRAERLRRLFGCGAGVLLFASALWAQEHSYTQADIENGARLYQSSCAGCHGPNGDMVPGIELQRGRFRRATSDTEIMRLIQLGIPGTTMPPSSFTEAQAGTIVAFLRSSSPEAGTRVVRGSTGGGRALFEGKGRCATCHRVNGVGPRVAPDLSDIGAIRPATELEQKLIDPNALVRPANRSIEIVMKDGTKLAGHLLNQDTFSIQLLDASERLRSVAKADLRDYTYVKNSPMPSYRDALTPDELRDLVTYLVSLKGDRP